MCTNGIGSLKIGKVYLDAIFTTEYFELKEVVMVKGNMGLIKKHWRLVLGFAIQWLYFGGVGELGLLIYKYYQKLPPSPNCPYVPLWLLYLTYFLFVSMIEYALLLSVIMPTIGKK